MAGLNLAGSMGAAAGAQSLEDMLKTKFLQQLQARKFAEDQRQADMTNAIQQRQLGQGDERLGLETKRLGQEASQFMVTNQQAADRLGMEKELQPVKIKQMTAQTEDLNRQPQEALDTRAFREKELGLEHQNRMGEIGATGANALRVANARPQPLATVQTVDAQGNPVTQFVQKKEGDSYVKPANATTATRVASAQTVNEVGADIIKKLADPKFRAVVGPAMGRASTLQDFIGNPPPEFSELAGQIESYALANMGVHGMRSAQGAEMIKKLLQGHHTPESLAATIRGLNDFSTRFVEHNQPKAGQAGAKPQTGGADPLGIR